MIPSRLALLVVLAVSAVLAIEVGGNAVQATPVSSVDSSASSSGPASAGAPVPQGDADCSTVVDLADVTHLLKVAAETVTDHGCADSAGDVDCIGGTTLVDALLILRFVAGVPRATPGGCSAINTEVVIPATSEELIAQALAAGDIDAEQALLYKMFAGFGDSRLPVQYHSADGNVGENSALDDVVAQWDGLSQTTKDTLAPFLKSPAEPGSWESLPSIGSEADAMPQGDANDYILVNTTKPVDVWYHADRPGDAAKAQQIADAISGTIWDSITGLMGKTPIADCGNTCSSGGPDSKLDIYIAREDSLRAFTIWNPTDDPTCNLTPALIVLARGDSLAVVAHEFMHAVQFAFYYANCIEASWWWEATAEWAMDYVYPSGPPGGPPQEEHAMASAFLGSPEVSLDFKDDSHEYSDYLLSFFIARKHNLAEWVPATFLALTSRPSLEAINHAMEVNGLVDFDKVWPQFTLDNWNREPVDDYKTWDQLFEQTDPTEGTQEVDVGEELSMSIHVPYLAAQYEQIVFTNTVKKVEFKNGLAAEGKPHQAVWGIVKIGDEWQEPEDLSKQASKSWCRDVPEQNIQELVLVYSNSDWQGKHSMDPVEPSTVTGKGVGCQGWSGTMTAVQTWDTSEGHGNASSTFTGTWVVADPDAPVAPCQSFGDPDVCILYTPDGTISWSWDAHVPGVNGCSSTTSGSLPAGESLHNDQQVFFLQPMSDFLEYKFYGAGNFVVPTQDCYNPITSGQHPPSFFNLSENADASNPPGDGTNTCYVTTWRIVPDAQTIDGSCYEWNYNYHSLHYEWHLQRVGNAIP